MTVDLNDETHTATTRADTTENLLTITEKQDKPQARKKERKKSETQQVIASKNCQKFDLLNFSDQHEKVLQVQR